MSTRGIISQYIKAHREIISLSITPVAKAMLQASNEVSYSTALTLPHKSVSEIEDILKTRSFERPLTDNQKQNLNKISQFPGAATFSVPGAGKTTEALAFFFINAEQGDRLLVVAPKNAFGAWDEQLEACAPCIQDHFVRLRGGETAIHEALMGEPRFMIITYDQLLIRAKQLLGVEEEEEPEEDDWPF